MFPSLNDSFASLPVPIVAVKKSGFAGQVLWPSSCWCRVVGKLNGGSKQGDRRSIASRLRVDSKTCPKSFKDTKMLENYDLEILDKFLVKGGTSHICLWKKKWQIQSFHAGFFRCSLMDPLIFTPFTLEVDFKKLGSLGQTISTKPPVGNGNPQKILENSGFWKDKNLPSQFAQAFL